MPRQSLRDGPSERSRAHPGDVSRRVAQRREQLGLSREEVAAKAGMTPSYVRYVEEQCHHTIGTNALLRLAGALRTTASHLLGGDAEHVPGETEAVGPPVMEELLSQECWTRLSGHDVGRIALTTCGGHPAVVPVNYAVVDGAIVYRTAADAPRPSPRAARSPSRSISSTPASARDGACSSSGSPSTSSIPRTPASWRPTPARGPG